MKSREGRESSSLLESSISWQHLSIPVHQMVKNSQRSLLEDGPKQFKSVWEKTTKTCKKFLSLKNKTKNAKFNQVRKTRKISFFGSLLASLRDGKANEQSTKC